MKGFYNLMDIYEMSDKCECTFIYFDRVDRAYRHRVPLLSKTGFSFRLLALGRQKRHSPGHLSSLRCAGA